MFLTSKMSIFCEKHRLHFFSMWKCKENLIVAAQWAAGKRQILVEHIIKFLLSQISFHLEIAHDTMVLCTSSCDPWRLHHLYTIWIQFKHYSHIYIYKYVNQPCINDVQIVNNWCKNSANMMYKLCVNDV